VIGESVESEASVLTLFNDKSMNWLFIYSNHNSKKIDLDGWNYFWDRNQGGGDIALSTVRVKEAERSNVRDARKYTERKRNNRTKLLDDGFSVAVFFDRFCASQGWCNC
jgi:hypothetical protein